MLSRNIRTFVTVVGLVLMVLLLMNYLRHLQPLGARELSYTELVHAIEQGTIQEAVAEGDRLTGTFKDGTRFYASLPPAGSTRDALVQKMLDAKISVRFAPEARTPDYLSQLLGMFLVILIFGGLIWFLLMRSAQAGNNQAFSFGKARAKRYNESIPRVTFDDVAGVDEAKQELAEIVDYLKNTRKYQALGAKIPKGVLLLGPPGCGKTLLARAVAGEAGVPFFHISGSDFVEMFVGVGAARVRDLFETAKANRPALIFIDEIDAVGRLRGAGLGGGHDEREQTLNQLLVEMDGFDPNQGIIVIAATNRADILDPALLRPGRFDRHIVVDPPDVEGRKKILEVHTKGKPLAPDVNLEVLAKRTPGFTGADLANLVNEAALLAARRNKTRITMDEFEEAIDRVIAGPQRRSRVVDEKERLVVAYHEVGHALVGELLPEAEPVHKISILPRGMALGYTIQMPERDRYLYTKSALLDRITALLGGRVAEEIVFGEVGTGAQDDLKRATELARAMVTEFGMSEKLGPLTFGRRHGSPFLGRDLMEDRNYSEQIAYEIDQEVRRIIEQCYQRAKEILSQRRETMDRIVQVLLEREHLNREEFLALLHGEEGQGAPATEPAPEPTPAPPSETEAEAHPESAPAKKSLKPRAAPS
ncbi:MAG: ATP-dependent zinc metalloprotease FtsH [Fimbriimonadales bacterium]|jgi:cell division protease FtsH|nr:ATP-dependent zinc metalloprotease FtsH [Fimbriimonadales bacterium]GIV13908.1 MAG: ATP-dependent zinc metalloprotease FtsH [Fimbriimonadales bacterium]CUU00536.1 membrane protease FtsH catalytic subunit [Armatimonadetes bacterium GBS]CUU34878.1 membrane protease FtsH catalytic subunit [Armatimonadetes bacterium GXS]